MRKFTLLIAFISFSVFTFAQSKSLPRVQKQAVRKTIKTSNVDVKSMHNEKAIGEVIWQDDFSDPTKWAIASADNQKWIITDTVSLNNPNPASPAEYAIGYNTGSWSPTFEVSDENGYALFDSDEYCGNNQNANITTKTAIDLSNYQSIEIRFKQRIRLWTNTVTNLQVSTDNGKTWKTFEVNVGRETKDLYEETVKMNISSAVAGKPSVKIRFNYVGDCDYLWAVDDVQLVVGSDNELILNTAWLDFAGGGYVWGYYSNIPLGQQPILAFYKGAIYNNGTKDQTNISLNVSIDDNNSVVHEFSNDSITATSLVGAHDTIYAAKDTSVYTYFFTDTNKIASYNVNFTVDQAEVDDDISNNKYQVKFNVTDTVFSRDFVAKTYTGPGLYVGGADGDRVGVEFSIGAQEEVSSVSAYISTKTTVGTSFMGKVFVYDGSSMVEAITTEAYEITANDLGKWVTLNFVKDGVSEFIENKQTYVMLECYFEGIGSLETDGFYVGADNSTYQTLEYSKLQVGGETYYIDAMPMVRLNVESKSSSCSAFISSKTNITCKGANDGKATVATGGCAEPYTIKWSNGATTAEVSGLAAGTYTVIVTDKNSSISEASVTISEPQELSISETKTDATGIDTKDGIIDITVNGGTPAYSYIWSNGAKTQDLDKINNGAYLVTVTDANKCVVTKSIDLGPSSVEKITTSAFSVYPNPTKGNLNISNVENANISIMNILGEQVLNIKSTNKNAKLNLNNLSEGIYILRIEKEGKVYSEKITLRK